MRIKNFNDLLSFKNWSAKTKDKKFGVIITWLVLIASATLFIVTGVMGKRKLNKFRDEERKKKLFRLYELETNRNHHKLENADEEEEDEEN